MYSFEWDQYKSKINQSKHGVTFEEAMTVFYDENALLEYDNCIQMMKIDFVSQEVVNQEIYCWLFTELERRK